MKFGKISMRFFYPLAEIIVPYFSELRSDLKRAGIKLSVQEFLSQGIFLTTLAFIVGLPFLSIILTFFLKNFLFGFLTAITSSFFILAIIFIVYINYPKIVIGQKTKKIDDQISFAAVHLSTLASTKLPLNKIFEIFSKFGAYGELRDEFSKIESDMKMFGLDTNTALQRAVERSPSKNLKELLWGIFSTNISGGDIDIYLREKSKTFMSDYRMKLRDFSHQLAIYIEIYLTAVVLGTIFFVILTSIVAGLTGVGQQVLALQFFLIFILLPVISALFIYLVKISTPGGE
jgi:flagellar protein FlaJ